MGLSGSGVGERDSLTARIRSWELWSTPRAMLAYVLAVEALVVPVALLALVLDSFAGRDLVRAGVIAVLAVGFEEFSLRIARLRTRLATYSHVDMNSVWTFAAAMVLPAALLGPLCLAVVGNTWLRHGRAGGYRMYRQFFAGAVALASCYAARLVLFALTDRLSWLPVHGSLVLALLVALPVYMLVNATLLHIAIYIAVRPERVREIFGSWADISLEFATLCLGGLTALAILREPVLAVLVVPPMFVLQRSVLTKQLEIAATTDAKTGLLNAATWHHVAGLELARAARESYEAAVLIVDMDNFKTINDTHGHLTGDDVLRAVADCLAEEMRGYDAIGRFGGEEFVAILSEVDEDSALMICERIRERIAALSVPSRMDEQFMLTAMSCSIGVARFPAHGGDVETLLHAADAALYTAKRGGRNRVELSA
jgi:diguanylate cyclase (GGDEF)-like protein